MVAGLGVVSAFFISIILIPVLFSFLPPPSESQLRHLDRRTLNKFIRFLDKAVQNYRPLIYTAVLILVGISLWGTSQIRAISRMADDLPKKSQVYDDLRFMEDRFKGVMPFEILVDTKKKKGVQKRTNINKIHSLQEKLSEYPEISRTISVADFAKFARQAFLGGDAIDYDTPSRDEFNFIKFYLSNTDFGVDDFGKKLADSLQQRTRISGSIRDVGSLKMQTIVDSIEADIDRIFDPEKYDVNITGTTKIYVKGNEYLIDNLLISLTIAFVVVGFIMGLLFRSFRMVALSLVPNFAPLLFVAGIMGIFGIALKPSTALVFSVSFGIAVDDSIHFLARYRQSKKLGSSTRQAVSETFKDTGVSMIYTSLILFFGFVIFTASDFGSIVGLGLLTSLTLIVAMFSNLLLLPSLLITFDNSDD